jgi:hypothetical protein
MAHEVKAFVRNVMGDVGDEVAGANTSKLRWILGFMPER